MLHPEMYQVKTTSQGAIARAGKASPTEQRCLVRNCPKEWDVEAAHVVPRERTCDSREMKSMEWSWNMRKGTLNLDTRQNIFFLSPTMYSFYKKGKWALLPTEGIVDRFFHKSEDGGWDPVLDRYDFPEFSETEFQYTFLPLTADLSKSVITRQCDGEDLSRPGAVKNHLYPFTDLPALTSHIHPKFVLLHLSQLLERPWKNPYLNNLVETDPLLGKVSQLAAVWCRSQLPLDARTDPSFITIPTRVSSELESGSGYGECDTDDYPSSEETESNYDFNSQSSDGDSVATPPRRLQRRPVRPVIPVRRMSKRRLRQMDGGDANAELDTKRKRAQTDEDDSSDGDRPDTNIDSGWTKEDISTWARHCLTSPPPTVRVVRRIA